MASDNEATCESDPNFAVICAFMEKFGTTCGLASIDFLGLQEMLENTQEVPQELIDLHIKLLRKSRKTVSNERWEKAVIKFCHTFCAQDAWEIERFGYKKARLSSKLRVLKELLEMQFDYNARFKAEINKMSAEELRSQPLGKDKQGHAYWFQNDNNCQIRVYKEDPDEETWTLVAKDRDGLVSLINELSDGDSKISTESAINEEDSNSLVEKPIIDTGQVDSSSESSNKLSENSNESVKKEENISEEDEEITSKRQRESDEDTDAKRIKLSEEIEEPLMLVKGEGAGEENQCPIIGEEIEEEVMIITGEGSGRECMTGNEEKPSTSDKDTKSDNSINEMKNCMNSSEVPTSTLPVKNPYKLGTIIDTKTDNKFLQTVRSPTKKSRWDVETIIAKEEDSIPETGKVKDMVNKWEQINEEMPKKPMFFFGPGCLQFKPAATVGFGQKVPQEKKTEDLDVLPTNAKGDIGYRINEDNEETPKHDKSVEPVPVSEELCVKKHAYVCGNDEETKIHQNQESDNHEEKAKSEIVDNIEKNVEIEKESQSPKIEDKPNIEENVDKTKSINEDTKADDLKNEDISHDEVTIAESESKLPEILVETKTEEIVAGTEPSEDHFEEDVKSEEIVKKSEVLENKNEDILVKTKNEEVPEHKSEDSVTIKAMTDEKSLVEQNNEDNIKTPDTSECKNEETIDDKNEETSVELQNKDSVKTDELGGDKNEENLEITVDKSEEIIIEPKNEESAKLTELSHDIIEEKLTETQVSKSEETVIESSTKEECTVSESSVGKLQETSLKETKLQKENVVINEEISTVSKNEDQVSVVTGPKILKKSTKPTVDDDNMIKSEENTEDHLKAISEDTSSAKDKISEETKIDLTNDKIEEMSSPKLESKEDQSKENSVIERKIDNEKEEQKVAPINKRGRKNNSSEIAPEDEKQPRVMTRRATRSSKNGEKQTENIEELQPPSRRGRPRTSQKTEKEESGKKMKMTDEKSNNKMEKKEEVQIKQDSKEKEEIKENEKEESEEVKEISAASSPAVPETVTVESSNSSDVVEVTETNPEEESKEGKEEKVMSLANFSLDFTESPSPTPTPPVTRIGLRKRGRESPQNSEEIEETSGKRMKMKAKRAVDVKLRKSIEEQKKQELASSDDDSKNETEDKKKKSVKKAEDDSGEGGEKEKEPKKNKLKNKNRRLLSNLGIDPDQALGLEENQIIGVRQSRRIAQLKIKEEAERRKFEEEMLQETHKKKKSKKSEDKDYKVEKRKSKNDIDDEDQQEDDSTDSKKRKKKKKKYRKFDEFNPWRSSSDSSTSEEEEEEEIQDEEEDEVLQYVSDHEFSPESDMEGDGEAQPLKRARTVRKESDVEEEVDDCPCQKCGKSDHPEWILLCDSCDNGWHCSCLRPPLMVVPEGDWFCPPCQHSSLLNKLQEKLKDYDKKLNKKEIEDRRKQRLAYVGISLNSVLPTKDTENIKKRRLSIKDDEEDDDDDEEENGDDEDAEVGDEEDEESSSESESGSASASQTGSDSDEPIYQLRQRRQAHSYRFNDYDELINSAIQDEMEAVKGAGNQGRGKDIATIVNAEKEEELKKGEEGGEEQVEQEPLPPVVPLNDKDKEAKPIFSDDENIGVRKKIIGKKKHRKLNSLDISSEDEDSDEDFKGTSDDEDDEDFDEDLGSEDSEEFDSGRNRRKGEVRRSTRARTSRYDADFIDDGDSEDEDETPRRKKKRSFWDESESEESDRSWGRRRKKPTSRQKKTTSTSTSKKKKSKKKKKNDDSDAEVYKKKKPKIKFGLDGEDEGPGRRTRGKKINYVDALGSDSDEDRVKRPPPRIESEEEYEIDEDDKASESGEDTKKDKVQIQSYTDARFTQILPEPKNILHEDGETELNPIDQINRNVEMMDENEMEKMMEEEEYANKQLQLVAQQLEKEKRRKEREAKKAIEDTKMQFMQEPLVGNVIINSENNDELSEPPGVSLPLFAELGDEDSKKRRNVKNKKTLEETVANLGKESNIEIAAPPQPFSQSQPTPSVITRMLQSKPGQPGYPVGAIRPKQFAAMPEREEQYIQGVRPQLSSPYRFNHYPPRAPLMYHPHRPMDPSPSGGGTINLEHSPGRVVSPAAGSPGKTETPPPPYSRGAPPPVGRFPRHTVQMVAPHLQPTRPNLSPYHPGMPPTYHYGQFGGGQEDAALSVYPPYAGEGFETQVNPSGENSKSYDEESGGEFGGLVSYFSSQREDDLES